MDADLKSTVTVESLANAGSRSDTRKAVKKVFEDRYLNGKNRWFFSKLRF